METIDLFMTVGSAPRLKMLKTKFLVVDLPSAYNAIIGRPTLNKLQAVVSTYHMAMKFPTDAGVGQLRSDPKISRECYLTSLSIPRRTTLTIQHLDPRHGESEERTAHPEPAEELLEVPLSVARPDQTVRIGTCLLAEEQEQLQTLLRRNADLFAWTPKDMPGIDRSMAEHRLSLDPIHRPIRQKPRRFGKERQTAIRDEVTKLLAANFIREVDYTTWLSNVVMVKKSNGKWRMCVDFTDLNKACPKDSYPLPRIDKLVDSTCGFETLSFMDAFSGYNQIRMAEEDEAHTAFTTEEGIYCYKVMPFGLKNAGATYQRMINKMFKLQIGRNMEAYVDDMLVKSRIVKEHLADLQEAFDIMRGYNMRLNPLKCAFGVSSEKFLGFLVHHRGIGPILRK